MEEGTELLEVHIFKPSVFSNRPVDEAFVMAHPCQSLLAAILASLGYKAYQ